MTSTHSSPQHPAPARQQVSLFALWFGLLAAPTAWMSNELILYYLASQFCHGDAMALPLTQGFSPWLLAFTVLALLVAVAGTGVSYLSWQKSRQEKEGSGHFLAEVGEGRTRFIAMFGLLSSSGFSVAFIFIFMQLYVLPAC